jgi:ATP-binding cassette subfamily F protein uup
MALLLNCKDVGKSFGTRPLFKNVSFGINDNDRIGMIGPNGAGKSTLLKILAGLDTTDKGEVSFSRSTKICHVAQDDTFKPDQTIEAVLMTALKDSHLDEYEKHTEVSIITSKVGFENPEQAVKELSGGWRKRLSIARQLIQKPNLLLMDEPTNHLDLEGILWLEKVLSTAPFACLVISHDRYFLERVCTRVIELSPMYPQGHFESTGSYSDFLEQRDTFLQGQRAQQETLANKARREIEWLRRGPKARTTKANSRIKEAHQLIDTLAEVKFRNSQNEKVRIDFTSSDRRTKKLIAADAISKSLGGKPLFRNLTLTLSPGIRLGLLGVNGSGKTTLLKTLGGEINPDSGLIERAEHLRMAYFDQTRAQLDLSLTLRRALTPYGDQVIYRDQPLHVATWAKKFLFAVDQLEMPLSSLSGGERARILIARLMQQPADILILDEPTNDLDIPTLEVLEDSLLDFPGAVVLVTHDRYLLDRVSTHLLAFDGLGGTEFFADYAQWEDTQSNKKLTKDNSPNTSTGKKDSTKQKKLSYKEQTELNGIEEKILSAENAVAICQKEMEDPKVTANAKKLQAACTKLQEAQSLVESLYKRWTELEGK